MGDGDDPTSVSTPSPHTQPHALVTPPSVAPPVMRRATNDSIFPGQIDDDEEMEEIDGGGGGDCGVGGELTNKINGVSSVEAIDGAVGGCALIAEADKDDIIDACQLMMPEENQKFDVCPPSGVRRIYFDVDFI